jgi:hypothetical protein
MTIANRDATAAYLHALNNMPNTRPGYLARIADRMAGEAFDGKLPEGISPMSSDAMMDIETAIFVGLCRANKVDWRLVNA